MVNEFGQCGWFHGRETGQTVIFYFMKPVNQVKIIF